MACKYYINNKVLNEQEIKEYISSNYIKESDIKLTTLGDIADILAYSNSKLILDGYTVVYTTPDNQQFKTYQEASNHISELSKSVEEVDLKNFSFKKANNINEVPDNFISSRITNSKTKAINFETIVTNYDYQNIKINKIKNKWYADYNYDIDFIQYEAENGVNIKEKYPNGIEIKEDEVINLYNNRIIASKLKEFIEKNKEYEQSKEIIEEWKKVNNIQYNPEEVYARGQEFVSVLGAYSSFDVNLMMQNLLAHIEDNEKAGGKFAISAFTKPIDGQIGHLEGGGGKIKFKIFPKSEDILWASNIDVYSGSVWDASEKVNKDKKSELLGVSYSKYPALNNVNNIQPNLADIIDKLSHHHNELGITLTGGNFRLEYDSDIPYQTKKIIDGINNILDQRYGTFVKPEIKPAKIDKYTVKETQYFEEEEIDDFKDFNTLEEAKEYIKSRKEIRATRIIIEKLKGIQPTQTKQNTKSIVEIQNKINNPQDNFKADFLKEGDNYYRLDEEYSDEEDEFSTSEPQTVIKKVPITKEEYESYKPKEKNYTSQALVNTKIAALKEVAKKYPRILIRSEVKSITSNNLFDSEEIPFQKITPKVYSASGKESTLYPKIVDYIKENGFNPNEPYYKDYLEAGYIKDYTPEELAIVHYNLAYPNENIEPAQLFETLTKSEKLLLENFEIDPNTISTAEAKLIVYNPNEAIRQTMTYYKTMRGNNTENFYVQVRDKQDKLYKDYGCM